MAKKGQKFPDRPVQELRNLVAVDCREFALQKKAEGATKLQQEQHIHKCFHGSNGYGSHLDLLLQGTPVLQLLGLHASGEPTRRKRGTCQMGRPDA